MYCCPSHNPVTSPHTTTYIGGIYFVFPGASSHRFEHSIGVSHLAREFATNLRIKQPGLGITDADILCVEIAGLVHDIGHGETDASIHLSLA